MKGYKHFFAFTLVVIALVFAAANVILQSMSAGNGGRPYLVEVNRLALSIEENGLENTDLSECTYIAGVEKYGENFYSSEYDYIIREINGELYRFDYTAHRTGSNGSEILAVNLILAFMSAFVIGILLYVRFKIISPFEKMSELPYLISKGNLNAPLAESKNRYFGKFAWGINMLRESTERQKQRELELQKEKKTLLLSLSHDIKTPLSAIKLYSKALSKGLYTDKHKQREIGESINDKADEIEGYVSGIINASREYFLSIEVKNGEFYLNELVCRITAYYAEKLSLIKTDFEVHSFSNCLLKGDIERSTEVLQNIIENAIKYGDGKKISVDFFEEDGCILISVSNGGCTLAENELSHVFESFWRGANAEKIQGSGLGLYICRQIMNKMGGEIFAQIKVDVITVTAAFVKA